MALACVAQVVLAEEERQNRNHNKENDLVSTEILVYQVLSFIQNPIFMKKLFKALFSHPQYSVSNLAIIYQKI